MRILFLSNFYPPHDLGGMELQCQEVIERMQARGHVCHVLTSRFGVHGQSPTEDGVTRNLHLEVDIYNYRLFDFFLHRYWHESANRRELHQALDIFQPDIVFIWGMWNLSLRVAYWSEKWIQGRIAYNIEGYWPLDIDPHRTYWKNPGKSRLARFLLWPLAQLALGILEVERYPPQLQFKHVSCCSQYVVDTLTKPGVIPPGAVAILNGIDPTPFLGNSRDGYKQDETLQLLYFGNLSENKGVHTAIEALGLLQKRGLADKLRLTIVGGGHPAYEAYLHKLTGSLAVSDKVYFTGRVPRSTIPTVLADHDVFLFTSIYAEPFGRTIVEAMAAGLAVIGADVGGSREIFEFYPQNMLFEPGNVEALANQIERLLKEPGLIQHLAQAGPELVLERFTLERMVDEMEKWLEEITG